MEQVYIQQKIEKKLVILEGIRLNIILGSYLLLLFEKRK